MADFRLSYFIVGALLGWLVAFVVALSIGGSLDKDRVAAGVFTYDGKAFLLLPIRNPAAAVPPG